MSNNGLAGNTNGNGFARRTRLGNRMLEYLASALMQIESNGRELVMRDKIIERIVDTHHAHVLGHAQAAIAQRCNRAICHLVVCRVNRRHGAIVLGQVPAGLVAAVGRPVALERLCRLDVFTLERILPTGSTKLLVDRERRAADIANLRAPAQTGDP